jgi:hypothetical protein
VALIGAFYAIRGLMRKPGRRPPRQLPPSTIPDKKE